MEAVTATDTRWVLSGWEFVVFWLIFLVGTVGVFAAILIHAKHARRRAQLEYENFLAHPTRGPK